MNTDDVHFEDTELTTARRQITLAAVIGCAGDIGGALLTSVLYGGGFGNSLRYAHAAVCAAVFATTLVARPARGLYMGLFSAMVVPLLPLLIVWTLAIPESKISESFIAIKMVVMGVALLTPLSAWLGLGLVALLCIETVALGALNLAGHLPGEPWVTLFYAVFAAALLVLRDGDRRLTRRLMELNSEAAALDRIARSSLEVRDRMNTPLQTLELSIDLLEGHTDESVRKTVERMRRALVRLTELSRKLAEEDPNRRRR